MNRVFWKRTNSPVLHAAETLQWVVPVITLMVLYYTKKFISISLHFVDQWVELQFYRVLYSCMSSASGEWIILLQRKLCFGVFHRFPTKFERIEGKVL